MKRFFFLSVAALLQGSAAVDAQAQLKPAPTIQTIEACRAFLTEAGRAASFQGTAVYEVVSESSGAVSEIRPVKVPDVFGAFVQVKEFRSCVQRWRFSGPGTTTVTFSAGTTGEFLKAWKISVASGSPGFTLVLPLPTDQ